MANKAVTNAASKGGIGIGTVCFIVFVIMKLTKIAPIASWSWLKVILLPVLISFVPTIIVLLLSLIGLVVMWLVIKFRR
jgi:hypothetical protein